MKYHYVYRVTCVETGKHYYGSRTSTRPPKEDVGKVYFTSSTDTEFKNDFKINPDRYKSKIVLICSTREEALLAEIKLHARFDVGSSPNFYNRCKQTSAGFSTEGVVPSKESREKMSKAQVGKSLSEEQKRKISESMKGREISEETRARLSKAKKGRITSEETKAKLSAARKGKPSNRKGVVLSEETRLKMSNSRKDKKHLKNKLN